MSSEWKSTTLGDVSTQVDYGYTASATHVNTGSRFLRITDIQDGVVDWRQVPYCEIDGASRGKYLLHQGDIVVARTGNSTGENFLYQGGEEAVFASYLIRFRVDASLVDPGYVWRCMRSSSWWNFIDGSKTGSAQAGANAKVLGLFEFEYPTLPEQKAIAHILGTLDDKIELNRKTNETLEAIAKALFKSWFVDFDPVRAKAEGRPTGLPAEISDLFPDSFEESELGEIPRGWKFTSMYDLADYINGASHSSEHLNHERRGLPVIKIAELKNGISDQTKHWDSEYNQKHLVVEGDVLFSWSGNPDTSIGTFVWGKERGLLNQHIFKVVPKVQANRSFILLLLKQSQTLFADIARDKQTTGLGHVTVKDLKESYCSLPGNQLLSAYACIADSLVYQCQALALQNEALKNIRNALLPKLISGEIRIPDAEKVVEDVGI